MLTQLTEPPEEIELQKQFYLFCINESHFWLHEFTKYSSNSTNLNLQFTVKNLLRRFWLLLSKVISETDLKTTHLQLKAGGNFFSHFYGCCKAALFALHSCFLTTQTAVDQQFKQDYKNTW